ncbi:MAG: glycosyltransferase [Candidatus Omnitrophota bacterium]
MKIIFVTREGYLLSGARIRCYGFSNFLRKHGIKAEVFSFADILKAKYGESELQMSFLEKVQLICKAARLFMKESRDAVFYIQRFNYHSIAPLLISLVKGNRIIFDMDDWDMRENPVYFLGFYPSSKAEYLTRIIAKRSVFCVAASHYIFDYLKQFNNRVYLIPTGVDSDIFNIVSKNRESEIVFSWIGTIYHKEIYEDVLNAIECFEMAANHYSNIRLELAGEGQFYNYLREIVNKKNISKKIIFHDWIHPDAMPDFLSRVDIGLLPLFKNTRFNKAKSPTKLFEYMAMSKPVISSNIGEARFILDDNKTGFLVNNKNEFIMRMEELIVNPELRRYVGIKARKEVEIKYSLKILGNRMLHVLKEYDSARQYV